MRHVISSDLGVEEASDGYFLVVKTPNPGVCHIISLDLGVEDENRVGHPGINKVGGYSLTVDLQFLIQPQIERRSHLQFHPATQ